MRKIRKLGGLLALVGTMACAAPPSCSAGAGSGLNATHHFKAHANKHCKRD